MLPFWSPASLESMADLVIKVSELQSANFVGANLSGADLASAKLSGANPSGANLTGVQWSDTLCPDYTNSNVDGGTCANKLGW
jgi:uncharacterized protein YjbI with pentapeptide repeats